MSNDLLDFLRARLDHDESHAIKDIWCADQATPGKWKTRYGVNLPSSWVETDASPVAKLDASGHQADAMLIGRFKPENVRARAQKMLADVAAKRAIIELHEARDDWTIGPDDREYLTGKACVVDDDVYPCETLELLAWAYRDHSGYRDEWAPQRSERTEG